MQFFRVGGCVRDTLMGRAPSDVDFVVVGGSHEEMLAQGYEHVGAHFPVYLDSLGTEFALARREVKDGEGYTGFNFDVADVTLEEDLSRRDLTINSMAFDVDGKLVDPFGGRDDLDRRVLRHTSNAFAEDPVRVLRLARFRARWGAEWTVAPETRDLVRKMGKDGVLGELQKDRVWKEFSRSMMEGWPRLFFDTLFECDVLHVMFPMVYKLKTATESFKWHPEGNAYEHTMLVLTQAAVHQYDLDVRLAAVCHDLGKGETPRDKLPAHYGHESTGVPVARAFCEKVGAPAKMTEHALKATRWHMHLHKLSSLKPKTVVDMFVQLDAWRDERAVPLLMMVGVCDSRGRLGGEHSDVAHVLKVMDMWDVVRAVKFADVFPHGCTDPAKIKDKMFWAREKALREHRRQNNG